MITTPMKVSPLITSDVTPSVTSCSSASMSLVRRLTVRPVGVRSWYPSSRRIRCRKVSVRRSSSTRSPTQLER